MKALLVNMGLGIIAIYGLDTAGLITLSALGAVTLYVISMLALIALRRKEPNLPRPYRTPLYPLLPIVALVLAGLALGTMLYGNFNNQQAPNAFERWLSVWYVGLLLVALAYFALFVRPRLTAEDLRHFGTID